MALSIGCSVDHVGLVDAERAIATCGATFLKELVAFEGFVA
jgi:hypothetical protein